MVKHMDNTRNSNQWIAIIIVREPCK